VVRKKYQMLCVLHCKMDEKWERDRVVKLNGRNVVSPGCKYLCVSVPEFLKTGT